MSWMRFKAQQIRLCLLHAAMKTHSLRAFSAASAAFRSSACLARASLSIPMVCRD